MWPEPQNWFLSDRTDSRDIHIDKGSPEGLPLSVGRYLIRAQFSLAADGFPEKAVEINHAPKRKRRLPGPFADAISL